MCWSATADLVAGAGISAAGVASVASVRRGQDLPLACLPLLLGAHQLIESIVWRGQDGQVAATTTAAATTAWAIIAFPLLPAFVPFAVVLAGPGHPPRRLLWCCAAGALTSIVLAVDLATSDITAHQVGHTLTYRIGIPAAPLVIAGYLVATLGSMLLGPDPLIRRIGLATSLGALSCLIIWQEAFASTWCALAALTSLLILRWVRRPTPT